MVTQHCKRVDTRRVIYSKRVPLQDSEGGRQAQAANLLCQSFAVVCSPYSVQTGFIWTLSNT